MRRRVSRLSPCRRGSFHELVDDVVRVVLESSCVSEDESELDDVDAEELGLESIDARESMGVAGRGAVVCGPLWAMRGPTLSR